MAPAGPEFRAGPHLEIEGNRLDQARRSREERRVAVRLERVRCDLGRVVFDDGAD